jgi:hypothetical protein
MSPQSSTSPACAPQGVMGSSAEDTIAISANLRAPPGQRNRDPLGAVAEAERTASMLQPVYVLPSLVFSAAPLKFRVR